MTPGHAMAPRFTTLPTRSCAGLKKLLVSRFSETAVTKRMKHLRLSRSRLVPMPALHHMIALWNSLRCKAGWAVSSPIWVSVDSPAKHEDTVD
ncbi:hypothetical protein L208DRAFT_1418808 [Tricholoma matsutake]|nr:hypothetical protein L208DRAFT_1418808 [Tricholoma matsutake 945]